jgi:hypothetical protein
VCWVIRLKSKPPPPPPVPYGNAAPAPPQAGRGGGGAAGGGGGLFLCYTISIHYQSIPFLKLLSLIVVMIKLS